VGLDLLGPLRLSRSRSGLALLSALALAAAGCGLQSSPKFDDSIHQGEGSFVPMPDSLHGDAPGVLTDVIITPSPIDAGRPCGNGVLDKGETCDPGLQACCNDTCDGVKAKDVTCRDAKGSCDAPEACDGRSSECPTDALVGRDTECRAAAGECDVAERCDGSHRQCPVDSFKAATTLCRASSDACDVAESCNGASAACPDDAVASSDTQCRAAASGHLCDVAERCDGESKSCPADGAAASDTVCRLPTADCDAAEVCDGTGKDCPPATNAVARAGTICRQAAGPCDLAEVCDGASTTCPSDALVTDTTHVCRAPAGSCDLAETCTGTRADCPSDAFVAQGTECRASGGPCDPAESCGGTGSGCPADAIEPSTTPCRAAEAGRLCDVGENCDGTHKGCPADGVASNTTPCRAVMQGDDCDAAENCDGNSKDCPADLVIAANTKVCRAPLTGDDCDAPESCDGRSKTCPTDLVIAANSKVCRPVVNGDDCDAPESCDGRTKTCPTDAVIPANTKVCRPVASGDTCDVPESCDGNAKVCPGNGFAGSAVPCRAAADLCDAVDLCPGNGPRCPPDKRLAEAAPCNGGLGTCSSDVCCPGTTLYSTADKGCGLGNSRRVVFVSSSDQNGAFTGLAQGDAKCQSLAAGANLAGTYSAWLSTGPVGAAAAGIKAIDRIGNGPYVRVDGTVVAVDKPDLTDGALGTSRTSPVPINVTEWNQTRATNTPVWTGTSAAGASSGVTCSDWSTTTATGSYGLSSAADATWTFSSNANATCSNKFALYCFQDSCAGKPGVDLTTDPDNCGSCSNACGAQQLCIKGKCGGYVFVTSTQPNSGAFGGLAAADNFCNQLAKSGPLPGLYHAWLSASGAPGVPASTRILDSPYYLPDGRLVASGLAQLLGSAASKLTNGIDVDEHGASTQFATVWTGTDVMGNPTNVDCSSWSKTGTPATVGVPGATTPQWTDSGTPYSCDKNAALYCFQISR
jgi:hypothetical protein